MRGKNLTRCEAIRQPSNCRPPLLLQFGNVARRWGLSVSGDNILGGGQSANLYFSLQRRRRTSAMAAGGFTTAPGVLNDHPPATRIALKLPLFDGLALESFGS
jgi:hypothetical protein